MPVHVGEATFQAVMAVGQSGMIHAQQMKDGCVQVVAPDGCFGFPGPWVTASYLRAGLDACPSQPGDKSASVVVSA